jgi:hypothetical protein
VRLIKLGTESGQTGCPTLFATDRGTYVVQGWRVDDPETLGQLDVPVHESCVEVPAILLHRWLPEAPARPEDGASLA